MEKHWIVENGLMESIDSIIILDEAESDNERNVDNIVSYFLLPSLLLQWLGWSDPF